MSGFDIFIERIITEDKLKAIMKELYPNYNFYEWDIHNNIIGGVKDRELGENDVVFWVVEYNGLFKSLAEFYRFPNEEIENKLNLHVGILLSNKLDCKVTIDGYSYCDFDQMPIYSLLIENNKAYLIYDCYPENDWANDDPRIADLKIKKIKEIDISSFVDKTKKSCC